MCPTLRVKGVIEKQQNIIKALNIKEIDVKNVQSEWESDISDSEMYSDVYLVDEAENATENLEEEINSNKSKTPPLGKRTRNEGSRESNSSNSLLGLVGKSKWKNVGIQIKKLRIVNLAQGRKLSLTLGVEKRKLRFLKSIYFEMKMISFMQRRMTLRQRNQIYLVN